MTIKQYPCYRLDPYTFKRVEVVNHNYDECVNLIDPDFDNMFAVDEASIIENILNQKEQEM